MLEPVLRRAVREVNSEHEARAVTQAVMGVLFGALVFAPVFVLLWMIFTRVHRRLGGPDGLTGACLLTGMLLLATFWSAWRRVDPMKSVDPLRPDQEATWALPQIAAGPRHASAGFAVLLLGGPENIVDAVASWRSRLRVDGPLYFAAADLLGRAAQGVELEVIDDPRPFVLLRRLRLVKVEEREEGLGCVVLTEKGRDALGEAGMVSL